MHLLLAIYLLNFNVYCSLTTQCSQNDKSTDLSLRSNFHSKRISKPCSDMWLSLRCHIIVDSSPFDATYTLTFRSVSPLNMNKLTPIFLSFIKTSEHLAIFMIPFSTWVLHPKLSIYPKNNRFFFRPLTCCTSSIVRIVTSNIFILTVPILAISKAWSSPMYTDLPEICSYMWNHSLREVMCQVALKFISHTSYSCFLPFGTVVSVQNFDIIRGTYCTPWAFDDSRSLLFFYCSNTLFLYVLFCHNYNIWHFSYFFILICHDCDSHWGHVILISLSSSIMLLLVVNLLACLFYFFTCSPNLILRLQYRRRLGLVVIHQINDELIIWI